MGVVAFEEGGGSTRRWAFDVLRVLLAGPPTTPDQYLLSELLDGSRTGKGLDLANDVAAQVCQV